MTLQTLLSWWNLIFVVPFGLALVYLALYTLGGVTFGEADGDAHFDADADADVDAHADLDTHADVDTHVDVHADADVDADAEVEADADADGHAHVDADSDSDADADADASAGGHVPLHVAAMAFLGVGRVPLSVLLMVMLMAWGAAGFIVNQIVGPRFGAGPRPAILSIPVAALVSLALTRLLVRVIDRWLPLNESSARRRHELLGRAGEALFPIDRRFGLAAVRDDRGELYQVACQLDPKLDAPLAKGSRVRLVAYSARTKSFFVAGDE